jgi:Cys-tRNA(Pro)/Cys-tRNA(Cys) deacylase
MSKSFPTYFAEEVILVDTMVCSAGKVGHQVEVKPDDLMALVGGTVADLVSN